MEVYDVPVVDNNNSVNLDKTEQSVPDTDIYATNDTSAAEEVAVDPKEEILKQYGPGGSFYKK